MNATFDVNNIEELEAALQDPFTKTPEPVKVRVTTKVNKVEEDDDLVSKYNLSQVNIGEEDKEILQKANEFVNFFKLRLFQFLMRRNRHTNISSMPHVIAGGFLSDAYMRENTTVDESACTAKDIDVFMQVHTEAFRSLDVETFMRELKQEITEYSYVYSEFDISRYERFNAYTFISMPYIFSISISGLPRMEIILSESLERVFDFDISIRHFFNFYGQEEVYASPVAIRDIEERKLTVICPLTPKSTLVRLFYFQKRYKFTIENHSYQLLAWVFKKKQTSVQSLYDYVINVEKFKNDPDLQMHLFICVLTFCEKYKTQYVGYAVFEAEFPYDKIFKPIFEHITYVEFHALLATKTFPYGFIGKFSTYIFSDKSDELMSQYSREYREALDNCKLGCVEDLYDTYELNDENYLENIHEDVKDYHESECFLKINQFLNTLPLPSDFVSKYFTEEFITKKNSLHHLKPELPPYANQYDIPSFIMDQRIELPF